MSAGAKIGYVLAAVPGSCAGIAIADAAFTSDPIERRYALDAVLVFGGLAGLIAFATYGATHR